MLTRTDSANKDFKVLVAALDEELKIRDGDDHLFYAALNKTAILKHAVVAYENGLPAGCGAVRVHSGSSMEVKRMYVLPEKRGKGIASAILRQLENWCLELGADRCILETGRNQPEAIAMYKKSGYRIIPNYGKYAGAENSVCFEKILIS
ncbi:MAG: GNAT family N-acetyltransferase [Chitinophagaceae bacterium]|nr:GNAT family N-acetyltransferase [Chitinophagaceae bacterium]